MLVGEHLEFNVAGMRDIALQDQTPITKGMLGFAPGGSCGFDELRQLVHHAHALAAAASSRFDQQREANFGGGCFQRSRIVYPLVARRNRHASCFHARTRPALITHGFNRFRRRPNKNQPGLLHRAGKIGIFG